MKINSYLPIVPKTLNSKIKYPLRDVLCLMSSSEIVGRKSKTFEKTIEGVLNKKAGIDPDEKMRDYFHARDYLNEKYPKLREKAMNLRKMLDSVNRNPFAITKGQAEAVFENVEKQFGNQFIELV